MADLVRARVLQAVPQRNQIPRVLGIGISVPAAGLLADTAGGLQALEWAAVVMAYCAGDRLRAAAIGPAALY